MSHKEEIVIGLVAPIGTNLEKVEKMLKDNFEQLDYEVVEIKITDTDEVKKKELDKNTSGEDEGIGACIAEKLKNSFYDKIKICNQIRRGEEDNTILAKYAIKKIVWERDEREKAPKKLLFLVRQFKRPEEIVLMRSIFGRAFFCLGINDTQEYRKDCLFKKLEREHLGKSHLPSSLSVELLTNYLIRIDEYQDDEYGQNIRETYPLCDYFMNSENDKSLEIHINHFCQILVHHRHLHPFTDETYMSIAYTTSRCSSSLSRQVGAVIVDDNDMIVSFGYNDVPKVGGGYKKPNECHHIQKGLHDIASSDFYKEKAITNLITFICAHFKDDKKIKSELSQEDVMDIYNKIKESPNLIINNSVEFYKDLHAENGAIVQAAANGKSTKNCTLYVTAFPCHMCTRNIIGAGIKRVVYIEPYPKSLTPHFYKEDISLSNNHLSDKRVVFETYCGIAPHHYLEAFDAFRYYIDNDKVEKSDRKNNKRRGIRFIRDENSYLQRQKDVVKKIT